MLAGMAALTGLDWARVPAWLAALLAGALAFAAMGAAIGGLAREVQAASLLAFALSLPVAFLALVPSGAVDDRLYTVIDGVSSLFPFKPALSALDAAIGGGAIGGSLLHLLAQTLGFSALARLSLRRFG
jgi:ABC-2 type transport system permease protein